MPSTIRISIFPVQHLLYFFDILFDLLRELMWVLELFHFPESLHEFKINSKETIGRICIDHKRLKGWFGLGKGRDWSEVKGGPISLLSEEYPPCVDAVQVGERFGNLKIERRETDPLPPSFS